MYKKILSVILSLIMITLLFSSCSGGENKELYYPIYSDPVSFDPQIASDNASKIVVFNCFEGLVRTDSDGNIIPGVAEKWEISSDGLVYTFHLRADAKWYMSKYAKELLDDDTAESFNYSVTADDFVYGFERAFDPSMGAVTDSRLYAIKNSFAVYSGSAESEQLGVTAINDRTLQIELSSANDDFLNSLTQSAAMPCRKEFFEATKGRYGLDPEKVIYNGPFYLYSWSTGSNITLYRNESYCGESEVKPSAVYLYINSDLASRTEKLLDGIYDACPLTVRQKSTIDDKNISYIDYGNTTWGYCFNCASEVMQNYDLRTALTSSAGDFSVTSGTKLANGIVPEICSVGGKPYRKSVGSVVMPEVDAKKAKKHLSDALDELGADKIQIKIICPENFLKTVKLTVQNWQSTLGVNVGFEITALDEIELESKVKSGDYDVAFTKITAESESVVGFLGMFVSSSANNIFNFKSKKYDTLISTADEVFDQEEILSDCVQAEQHLIDMSVFIPVVYESSFLALAKDVSGVYSVEAGTVPIFLNGLRK